MCHHRVIGRLGPLSIDELPPPFQLPVFVLVVRRSILYVATSTGCQYFNANSGAGGSGRRRQRVIRAGAQGGEREGEGFVLEAYQLGRLPRLRGLLRGGDRPQEVGVRELQLLHELLHQLRPAVTASAADDVAAAAVPAVISELCQDLYRLVRIDD